MALSFLIKKYLITVKFLKLVAILKNFIYELIFLEILNRGSFCFINFLFGCS